MKKSLKPGPKQLTPYSADIEKHIKDTYSKLPEKDRRRYAAVEALKLPHGSNAYIIGLLGCGKKTLVRGINELKNPDTVIKDGMRSKGAGRKSSIETIDKIDDVFLEVIDDHIAGDPMNEKIRWTNLSHKKISVKMKEKGISISVTVVKKLLKRHNFTKRKALKNTPIGSSKNRNEQFENITQIKNKYFMNGNPVLSMDTKKKELLGNLYRDGRVYSTNIIEVYDHDFPYLADGIVIPHTLFDLKSNMAYVNIGVSKDTSEFACDSIKLWWDSYGKFQYSNCTSILILADGGGSNSSRHYIFKEDLQKLVDEIGVEIRLAHYPPYTSKWNPVEHKVFPHITRSLKGVILRSHNYVKELIENTTTKTGLEVKAHIVNKIYKTGRKYSENFKETMRIIFDDYLGQWNYRAIPEKT
jgi:hypothetical protein